MPCRVRIESALTRRFGNVPQFFRAAFECVDHILGTPGHEKLSSRVEELIESFPPVAHNGRLAGSCFKQPAGGTVPNSGHGRPGYIQRRTTRRIKRSVLTRGYMGDEPHVIVPGEIVGIL